MYHGCSRPRTWHSSFYGAILLALVLSCQEMVARHAARDALSATRLRPVGMQSCLKSNYCTVQAWPAWHVRRRPAGSQALPRLTDSAAPFRPRPPIESLQAHTPGGSRVPRQTASQPCSRRLTLRRSGGLLWCCWLTRSSLVSSAPTPAGQGQFPHGADGACGAIA